MVVSDSGTFLVSIEGFEIVFKIIVIRSPCRRGQNKNYRGLTNCSSTVYAPRRNIQPTFIIRFCILILSKDNRIKSGRTTRIRHHNLPFQNLIDFPSIYMKMSTRLKNNRNRDTEGIVWSFHDFKYNFLWVNIRH